MGSSASSKPLRKKLCKGLIKLKIKRLLALHEHTLRNKMRMKCLGLASMLRIITRQRSRVTYLEEGDANTKFFHLQACNKNRKNHIRALSVDDLEVVHEEAKADLVFQHFNDLLGTPTSPTISLDFQRLGIPSTNMNSIDYCFSLMKKFGKQYKIFLLTRHRAPTSSLAYFTERPSQSSSRISWVHSMLFGLWMVVACM